MLSDRSWLTIEGILVKDLGQKIQELTQFSDRDIHIGTDSQQDGLVTQFVTVVIALQPGKGGRAFYCKEKVPKIRSLRERLMREVSLSVQVGIDLNEFIPDGNELTIHVDANPDVRFRSSNYVQELAGYVVG